MKSQHKPVLKINNLRVRRSRNFLLDIDRLELRPKQITCLAGANGSGKTTLLETVAGLIRPDKGKVGILGYNPFSDVMAVKCQFGFIPDDEGWIIPELTAHEYFQLLASIYKKAGLAHDLLGEANHLAGKLLFTNFNQQLGSLSHGNRKKVQIVAGLAHRPALLVVDELRNGLDPVVSKYAEDAITDYCREGGTVLAATHDLWWAERLSDRVVIINAGRIVLDQPTNKIKRQAGSLEAKFMELYDNHEP